MNHFYRVLLVDDEPIILRSLKLAIPWNQLNMEIVGTAKNGSDALEQAADLNPHIIVSDIRMPMIDGITLMKKILQETPNKIFIILSGYGEFEYAKQAIHQGAFDYLLKPIDHEELYNVILEARKILDEELHMQSERESLHKTMQSLSTLVRERMFAEMIEGTDQPYNTLYWLDEWEMEHAYFMLVVNLDHYATSVQQWTSEEKRLWSFAVTNILQEYGNQQQCLTAFPFHNGEWVLICQNMKLERVIEMGKDIVILIRRYAKLSCTVGISHQCSGLKTLNESYQSAQNALYLRFIQGEGGVYHDSDSLKQQQDMKLNYPRLIEKDLVHSIRKLDREQFTVRLRDLELEVKASRGTKETVERIVVELILVLYRQFESLDLITDITVDSTLEKINTCVTLVEITDLLITTLSDWMKLAMEKGSPEDSKKDVQKALEYISGRYHHDLGIDEVAEFIGLSCSHFCVLFKQVTGYTFLEYLTKYRIDKACSILQNVDVKVYQIAPLVGYQDPRYFTQVFKKITKMTPTEYRTAMSTKAD